MIKRVTKLLSSQLVILPMVLPFLSSKCDKQTNNNDSNSSEITDTSSNYFDERANLASPATLPREILGLYPSLIGSTILNNLKLEANRKQNPNSDYATNADNSGFGLLFKKEKNLFIDEMPSLHKELEKIFFNFNPKYTSKYEAKIVAAGFNDLEGELTLGIQILYRPDTAIENTNNNTYFQSFKFTGFRKFDLTNSDNNVLKLKFDNQNLANISKKWRKHMIHYARHTLKKAMTENTSLASINNPNKLRFVRYLFTPHFLLSEIPLNIKDDTNIYNIKDNNLTLFDVFSRDHKAIVYPFYGSLTSFDDIFDIPNNDSVKFDIYKNSENKEILKITINLTIVPGVQNIYTNIERSTKDKKKVTFSFQVEAPFDELLPDNNPVDN
ncbi:LppA-related lipoprotein [Mycoplasmopsis bovis]|uniref:LppA-related lipoprotein n=1 Tax=Mycoplasmopsis bovis TaxID=28903 RepID=UPI00244EF79F|nr:hypothetical protein [Mycoplasmopsis bovis]